MDDMAHLFGIFNYFLFNFFTLASFIN